MSGDLNQRETLAAEYVLGTLDPAERAKAEAERARDPAFARLIDDWSAKLSPVSEAVGEVAPPPGAWRGIKAALAARGRPETRTVTPSTRDTELEHDRPPLLQRLSFWRMSTAGAVAVAACLALYIAAYDIFEPAVPTRYVALLDDAAGDPSWLVTVDTDDRTLTAQAVADVGIDEGDLQLWMIKDAKTAVLSVGLLHPTDPRDLPIEEAAIEEGRLLAAAYAVSAEPPGGSPTGLPTGPMLYQGGVFPVERWEGQ